MVKKLARVCTVALVLSVLAVSMEVVSAQAKSPNAAVVIRHLFCILLDGNGNLAFTGRDQAVITSNGTSKFTCQAHVTPSSTAQGAVHWNFANTGAQCAAPEAITSTWEEVVTPSGHATLSCHFNGSSG